MDNLFGMTFERWRQTLKENHFRIDPPYWGRAFKLTTITLYTSSQLKKRLDPYREAIEEAEPITPTFVLGHWRSGTTLLHNLLSMDDRWGSPTVFDTMNPFIFLSVSREMLGARREALRRKRAMDNVEFDPLSPGEDEFAVGKITLRSPYIGWSFPKNEAYWDRYITFREATEREKEEWKAGFLWFLKGLHVKYSKPMLLKSPPHTGRIRLILELFPEARFIAIHRNPYQVFRSTRHFYKTALPQGYLQNPIEDQIEEGILRRYEEMHRVYFEDRTLIPEGHLHELAFEDLVVDPVREVKRIYDALGFDGFDALLPRLQQFVEETHRNYKRNPDHPLSDDVKQRIARRWRQSFEVWGYEV
jgi:hypothetical protein